MPGARATGYLRLRLAQEVKCWGGFGREILAGQLLAQNPAVRLLYRDRVQPFIRADRPSLVACAGGRAAMDPEMARLAMEQMKKMSPQQMAAMRAQMGNMDPGMMRAAMEQMNSMSTAEKERMRAQMAGMDPSQMDAMGQAGAARMSAQQKYELQASETLKSEGNALHKQGRFKEAAEKYSRAHANMATHACADARALKKACALNLASCHLKLGAFDAAVPLCSEVLAEEGGNVKALYRRGQAHAALKAYGKAVADLRRAVAASPTDEGIKGKLEEVTRLLEESGGAVEEPAEPTPALAAQMPMSGQAPAGNPAQAAAMMKDPNTRKMMADMMKNMTDEDLQRMAAMSGAPPGMTVQQMRQQYEMLESMDPAEVERAAQMAGGGATGGVPSGDQFQRMKEVMDKDPDAMKKMMESLSSMPQEQLDAMAKASGAPAGVKLTPEMVKMSADMMSKMTPEDMERMRAMHSAAPSGGTAAAAPPTAPRQPSVANTTIHDDVKIEDITGQEEGASTSSAAMATAAAPAGIPPGMGDMLAGMSEEQLASMAQMSGMPAGMMTPEMMKMAADMMKNMDPADMMRMQQMGSGMGMGGGAGMGAAGMSAEQRERMQQDMMSNPDSVKMVSKMMDSMDPKTLAAMSKSAGMEISEEQAAKMKDAMKNIKPEHMEKIMKVAGYAQKAGQKAKQAKEFMLSRKMFWFSLIMLLIAVVLRYLGVV
eukprot:jgi/Tetstr1/432462/TSEL_021838.t1